MFFALADGGGGSCFIVTGKKESVSTFPYDGAFIITCIIVAIITKIFCVPPTLRLCELPPSTS